MWHAAMSPLSAVQWHFSQLDGFLHLTSVCKGSANHSQRLPLDRDVNRALTDPVPPSLRLINSSPSKQDIWVLRPDAQKVLLLWAHNRNKSTHVHTNVPTVIICHRLTRDTMHHIYMNNVSPIIASDKTQSPRNHTRAPSQVITTHLSLSKHNVKYASL